MLRRYFVQIGVYSFVFIYGVLYSYHSLLQVEAEVATKVDVNLVVTGEKIPLPKGSHPVDFCYPYCARVDVEYNGPYGFEVTIAGENENYIDEDDSFLFLAKSSKDIKPVPYLLRNLNTGEEMHSGSPVCKFPEQDKPFNQSYDLELVIPHINPMETWGGDFSSSIIVTFHEVK